MSKLQRISLCSFSDKKFKVLLITLIYGIPVPDKEIGKNLNLSFSETIL